MRSTALLAASRAGAQALTFATAVLMAHAWAVDDYGRFVFAQAIAAIFIMLVDHGAQFALVQRHARDPRTAPEGFGRSWAARLVLATVAVPLVIVVWALAPADALRTAATALALAGAWCDGALLLGFAAFRVHGRFERESAITAAGSVLRLVLTTVGLALGAPLLPLLAVLAAGKGLTAATALLTARRLVPFSWSGVWDGFAAEARSTWPFLAFALTGITYFQAGTLCVSQLAGPREAGLFQAPYMLFLGGLLVPDAASNVNYPRLARAFGTRDPGFAALARAFVGRLTAIGVALGATLALLGPLAVDLLFPPRFHPAAGLARWLGGALALRALSYGFGTLIHACDGQVARAGNNAAVLLVLVAGGAWLVPRHGSLGMVQALLASELLLVVLEAMALAAALAHRRAERAVA